MGSTDVLACTVIGCVLLVVLVCLAHKCNEVISPPSGVTPARPRQPEETEPPGRPRPLGSVCPFIGTRSDVQVRHQQPTSRHVCHAQRRRRQPFGEVPKAEQARRCLTPLHLHGEWFVAAPALPTDTASPSGPPRPLSDPVRVETRARRAHQYVLGSTLQRHPNDLPGLN